MDIPGNSSIASKEEMEGTLRSAFLPTDRINLDVNTLLLKIGGELILVDSGAGGLFGPSLGKVRGRLSAAGVEPSQVTGNGLRVLGYHLPFPGIGHVRTAKGGAFEWLPEPWSWTTA